MTRREAFEFRAWIEAVKNEIRARTGREPDWRAPAEWVEYWESCYSPAAAADEMLMDVAE